MGQMDIMEEEKKQPRTFINERIVPRKKYKKVLAIIAATLGLAILFGVMAGISFYVSRAVVGKTDVSAALETIIIARDDTTAAPTTTEHTTTETEAAESKASDETEETTQEVTAQEVPLTGQEVYESVRDSFVTIDVIETGGKDWFDTTTVRTSRTFGVLTARTDEACLILTDGDSLGKNASIVVNIGGKQYPAAIYGYDALTKLCLLKIPNERALSEIPLISLGNSFSVNQGEEIIMAGAQYGNPGGCTQGRVTFINEYQDVTDGYEQYIYTDMMRSAHGAAVLLNMKGAVIGWVSDYTCIDDPSMVVACGISPLKYLIEDMGSGKDTAALGVLCVTVSDAESESAGVPAGLYVQQVIARSAAEEVGIQPGDRIVGINGRSVTDSHTLQVRIDEIEAGQTVTVSLERRGVAGYEPLELSVRFGSR